MIDQDYYPPFNTIDHIKHMLIKDGYTKAKVRLEAGQDDMFLMYQEMYSNHVDAAYADSIRETFDEAWPFAEKWVRQWIENEASKERAEEGLNILARRMKAMREGK